MPKNYDLHKDHRAHSCDFSFAAKITPRYTWDDIVLPEDKKEQLREVCNYVKHHANVSESLRFQKPSRGKGINVLFSGPSGTGKTMAAEIIARELKLDIYKIDLSIVVSKYIGETEKNLNGIFKKAEQCDAILFFDEADAIFGKRTEVRDAHDRYANIEINYLLQKMEEHEGIAILATNMSKYIDNAFLRRMRFIVEFPFPSEEDRLSMWQKRFPEKTTLDQIDFVFLSKLQITGGKIENIALAATFLAAKSSDKIKMEHVIKAAKKELLKTSKIYGKEEYDKYLDWIKSISDCDEHIRQSIAKILSCALCDVIFQTINSATLTLIEKTAREALTSLRLKIDVVRVNVSAEEAQAGKLLISVDYCVRATNHQFCMVYPFYMSEGK